jgi:HSP20 family protein
VIQEIIMNIVSRNPLSHSIRNRSSLFNDDIFNSFFRPSQLIEEARSTDVSPSIDIKERENDYLVSADMPGVKKENIDVQVENGVLTVTGEVERAEDEKDGERVIRQERFYGKYVRSLRLGRQIDTTKIEASLKDGVLQLTLPKAEEVKPKKVAIKVD